MLISLFGIVLMALLALVLLLALLVLLALDSDIVEWVRLADMVDRLY